MITEAQREARRKNVRKAIAAHVAQSKHRAVRVKALRAKGLLIKQVAYELGISERTVRELQRKAS